MSPSEWGFPLTVFSWLILTPLFQGTVGIFTAVGLSWGGRNCQRLKKGSILVHRYFGSPSGSSSLSWGCVCMQRPPEGIVAGWQPIAPACLPSRVDGLHAGAAENPRLLRDSLPTGANRTELCYINRIEPTMSPMLGTMLILLPDPSEAQQPGVILQACPPAGSLVSCPLKGW